MQYGFNEDQYSHFIGELSCRRVLALHPDDRRVFYRRAPGRGLAVPTAADRTIDGLHGRTVADVEGQYTAR